MLTRKLAYITKVEFKHKPVLLAECIENLNIMPNGIYVDGTLRRSRTQQGNC